MKALKGKRKKLSGGNFLVSTLYQHVNIVHTQSMLSVSVVSGLYDSHIVELLVDFYALDAVSAGKQTVVSYMHIVCRSFMISFAKLIARIRTHLDAPKRQRSRHAVFCDEVCVECVC